MFYDIYWLDEGNITEGHRAKSVAEGFGLGKQRRVGPHPN
jgi:hypothetical protein